MEDFESFLPTAAEKKKIPYDQDPIVRSSKRQFGGGQSGSSKSSSGQGFGKWKAVISLLVIAVLVLGILVGVILNRGTSTGSQVAYHIADSQYRSHTTADEKTISATATNVAMRSSVAVESHSTSSTEAHSYSVGSGVIIDDSNDYVTILTNYHVIYSTSTKTFASYIYILLSDYINPHKNTDIYVSRRILCEVVGGSYTNDIGVIRFGRTGKNEELYAASGAMPATIGDASTLAFGNPVFAVGNPNGDGFDVKTGVISKPYMIISVDVRGNNSGVSIGCLQTDAAINGGNSGGGLFDSNGNLIGIVNAKASNTSLDKFLENTAYAIPVNVAYGIAWNIVANSGSLMMPLLGVEFISESYTVDTQEGSRVYKFKTLVKGVDTSGVGFAAGIREGDQISKITYYNRALEKEVEVVVDYAYGLTSQLYYVNAGDEMKIEVIRNGATKTLTVTMGQEKKIG